MTGLVATTSDLSRVEGILGALGAVLPDAEKGKLRAFLAGEGPLDGPDDEARRIVDALKSAADRHWSIDPHRSVELANAIIAIGEARDDIWTRALGTMARGDAIKFIGSQQEAWDLLERAGELFQSISDEVGWARTWIGRLSVAAQLNRLPEAIEQAGLAREIFTRKGETLRQLRVDSALGEANWLIENHATAEMHYHRALSEALALGPPGEREARGILNNLGLLADSRGDSFRALGYFDKVAELARAQGEERDETICRLNIAMARTHLGHYRQALSLFHEIKSRYKDLRGTDAGIQHDIAMCLVALGQNEEADTLFRRARTAWLQADAKLHAARAALHQATAQARLGDFVGAQQSLAAAEGEFKGLGETGLMAISQLRRGQLALHQGDPAGALALTRDCSARFAATGQVPLEVESLLLEGEARFTLNQNEVAGRILKQTLERARLCASPTLIYSAHLALGRLAEGQGRASRALRRYAAAEATLERMQRNLTIALRPAFLASKLDAQRARTRLLLKLGEVGAAFETVERVRTQIMMGYLAGRESLPGSYADPISAKLAVELDRLRGVHHALTTREQPVVSPASESRDGVTLAGLEREIRAIVELLHLRRPTDGYDAFKAPTVADLQSALGHNEAILAYFDDRERLGVFVIDQAGISYTPLDVAPSQLSSAMEQLERNLQRALVMGDNGSATLLKPALSILKRLWEMLLAPVASLWRGRNRLFVIPYGQLHALPFNLLHNGGHYLIEETEVVTLPSSSLLLRRPPQRPAGAHVLAHDDGGNLPDVDHEVVVVQDLFSTLVESGPAATRAALRVPPTQILHIAAHGAHRTDNPDFSHIALADGQLFTDDLLQLDLSYELVTLSACETGRGRVTAGDETLGIGWAFLYAGAGAVISSLWRVIDARTAPLMARLYGGLRDGLSKSAALRAAQRETLAENPCAHPAFWGAFQLYGAPGALSKING